MTREWLVYGSGGFAKEVAWLIESCSTSEDPCQIRGFIDDDVAQHGKWVNEIPVMSFEDAKRLHPTAEILVGIGAPTVRQTVTEKVKAADFRLGTLVHPRVERSRWVTMDEGTIICAGCILTTNISLGKSVQINLDCTIGHDVILEDYVTLAPGVHVSGWVLLRRGVYVGTGAVFVNGTKDNPLIVGENAVIGAGACVTKPILAGETVVGVPAKALQKR